MKVYYAGFNLYGQLTADADSLVRKFIDFHYESLRDVILNHTNSILMYEKALYINGAHGELTHQLVKVEDDETSSGKVSCSDDKMFLLKDDGELLKLDFDSGTAKLERVPNFLVVENSSPGGDSIVNVSCGRKITVTVSKFGKVFNGFNKLKFGEHDISQVATGREHCLLLDADGSVYSFGNGR